MPLVLPTASPIPFLVPTTFWPCSALESSAPKWEAGLSGPCPWPLSPSCWWAGFWECSVCPFSCGNRDRPLRSCLGLGHRDREKVSRPPHHGGGCLFCPLPRPRPWRRNARLRSTVPLCPRLYFRHHRHSPSRGRHGMGLHPSSRQCSPASLGRLLHRRAGAFFLWQATLANPVSSTLSSTSPLSVKSRNADARL